MAEVDLDSRKHMVQTFKLSASRVQQLLLLTLLHLYEGVITAFDTNWQSGSQLHIIPQ